MRLHHESVHADTDRHLQADLTLSSDDSGSDDQERKKAGSDEEAEVNGIQEGQSKIRNMIRSDPFSRNQAGYLWTQVHEYLAICPQQLAGKFIHGRQAYQRKIKTNLDDQILWASGAVTKNGERRNRDRQKLSRKRSLLQELPTVLSDFANTPKRRPYAGDKERLEKATFNTARDSLVWNRHASELVFNQS